jgi:hypothetical protein
MRPPANIIRQWIQEKNSFSVRGLVMLNLPAKGWYCNIEILRVTREKLAEMPPDEAAFEVALSAIFRYITSTVYTGESIPVRTARGPELLVPSIAFDMAPFLVDKVKKILADGGGGINVNQVAVSQKFLARATTGSAKNAEAYALPKLGGGAQRVKHRLDYEAKLDARQVKAMAQRRKQLARYWLKRKGGSFQHRGLVFTSDPHGFWTFNVRAGHDMVEHTSSDQSELERLALDVSQAAVLEYSQSVNYQRDGETLLARDRSAKQGVSRVPPDVIDEAARRVSSRLLKLMNKNKHGILSHKITERCLSLAWDPEDEKTLEDYPFPISPSTDFGALDRLAVEAIAAFHRTNRMRRAEDDQQPPVRVDQRDSAQASDLSWREELDIDDWVPLDEPVEDDDAIDRRALETADHDQSAALRRIRGIDGGRITAEDKASPVRHKVDYAGLPKDED